MKTYILAGVALLAGAAFIGDVVAAPTYAQSYGVCLPSTQISSSSALDDRTLVVNDRGRNTFDSLVEVCAGCHTAFPPPDIR